MSKLSKYAQHDRRNSDLPLHRVLAVLTVAGISFAFCLAQLSLKFSLSDLQRETRTLQAQHIELQSRINRARGDVARLEKGDRLMEHARQLGMVQYTVSDVESFTVDPGLKDRYMIARANLGWTSDEPAPAGAEFGRAIAMRLGFEQPAVAETE